MALASSEHDRLVGRLNVGDLKAYSILYDEYFESMALYAVKIVGNRMAAEDIVQDIFVSIWEQKVTFKAPAAFRSYLFHAVRNRSINYLNTSHREVPDLDSYIHNEEGEVPQPFVEEEIYRRVFEAIDKLPKRCREVMLGLLDDKKPEALSKEINLSVHTIRAQKRRAIEALRKMLLPSK